MGSSGRIQAILVLTEPASNSLIDQQFPISAMRQTAVSSPQQPPSFLRKFAPFQRFLRRALLSVV
jgi:hypothetical protein